MRKFKVSIIIPVYNMERYLGKCIKSVLKQTYRNLEIILVDDGSTDESPEMCDLVAETDKRVKVIHKSNGGLVSAWKAGVEASTAQYLCFVDSDDWIDPKMIEDLTEHLTGSKKEIVSCDGIIEHEDGTSDFTWQEVQPGEYDKERVQKEIIPNLLGNEHRFIHASRCLKLISRKLILDNMKYADERLVMGEDFSVMIPAYMDMERFYLLDHKAYYHYRYVDSSMVHKYDRNLKKNIKLLHETGLKIINDKFPGVCQSPKLEKMEQEYVFLLFLVLKNEARGNAHTYIKNIQKVANDPEVKKIVKTYPVTVKDTANKLLYFVLKHPSTLAIQVLKMAFKWYYREKKNAA